MKFNLGDIIPFNQIQEATDYVNSIDGNYYLDDYMLDKQGRMMLIVKQFPAPSLDELKQSKINDFKSIRDTEEVKPIVYNGNLFDYDDKARDRINSAIIALDITGQSIEWTTADNTNVLVTADDLRGVVANVAVRSNQLHAKYRELKEQVLACETAEEVAEIVW